MQELLEQGVESLRASRLDHIGEPATELYLAADPGIRVVET